MKKVLFFILVLSMALTACAPTADSQAAPSKGSTISCVTPTTTLEDLVGRQVKVVGINFRDNGVSLQTTDDGEYHCVPADIYGSMGEPYLRFMTGDPIKVSRQLELEDTGVVTKELEGYSIFSKPISDFACKSEGVSTYELVGKWLEVVALNDQYICYQDKNENEYLVSTGYFGGTSSETKYKVFFQNDNGLTDVFVDVLRMGDRGILEIYPYAKESFLLAENTFEDVYPSANDVAFLSEWNMFRVSLVDYTKEYIAVPEKMNFTKFSDNFTPAEACEVIGQYSGIVPIGKEFSYCDVLDAHLNHVDIFDMAILQSNGDEVNLTIPRPGDEMMELKFGDESEPIVILGCFPVENYGDLNTNNPTFTNGSREFYFTPTYYGDMKFVDPVGVVFKYGESEIGEVVPAKGTLIFRSFQGNPDRLYSLPKECQDLGK